MSIVQAIHDAILSMRFVRLLEAFTHDPQLKDWTLSRLGMYPDGPCAFFVNGGLTVSLRWRGKVATKAECNQFFLQDESSYFSKESAGLLHTFHERGNAHIAAESKG